MVQAPGNLVAVAAQRTVVGVKPVALVGQQLPVLGKHDEQQSIEQGEAVAPAWLQIDGWVQVVGVVRKQTLDAQAQGLERSLLEAFPNSEPVLGAALQSALNKRFAAIHLAETSGAEEQVQVHELVNEVLLLAVVRTLESAIETVGQIEFEVGLKPPLLLADFAGDQAPELAVGQDAERQPAAVEIPLDLLGRILAAQVADIVLDVRRSECFP